MRSQILTLSPSLTIMPEGKRSSTPDHGFLEKGEAERSRVVASDEYAYSLCHL